jgi:hypothetical protein
MTIAQQFYNYLTNAKREDNQLLTPDMENYFDNDCGYTLWTLSDKQFKHFFADKNLLLIEIYPDEPKK